MSISFVSSDPHRQHKNVLEGQARRLRHRAAKELMLASGKRGTPRPNGLTVADRLLRYADEYASIELEIADLGAPGR